MAHKSVILAQADTLAEWADSWNRAATGDLPGSGYGEAAFLASRLERHLRRLVGESAPEPEVLAPATEAQETRPDTAA